MSSLSTSLKNSYQRWLHPYEEYLRTVKPGSQPSFDLEPGHAHSPTASPMKKSLSQSQENTSEGPHTQDRPLTANDAPMHSSPQTQPNHPAPIPPPAPIEAPRPISSGFMSINSGGFSSVNAPSGFTAVNHAPPAKREPDNAASLSAAPMVGVETEFSNGEVGSNPLKRTLSQGSANGDSGSDGVNGDGESGRRSKRLKKDVPTVAGSHMSLMRPSTPRMRPRTSIRKFGDVSKPRPIMDQLTSLEMRELQQIRRHREYHRV